MPKDTKSTHPPNLMVTPPPKPISQSEYRVSIGTLHNSIAKIAHAVNKSAKHTEQIPDIKKKVDITREKIVQLDTKMDATTGRVTKIEDRVLRGHDCYQVDVIAELKKDHRAASQKIDTDMLRGVEQETRIDTLIRDVTATNVDLADIKKAPRRLFYGLAGIILTLILGAFSASWFLAELSKDVEFERMQRTEQNKRMESLIKSVGTKSDNAPVESAIKNLEKELESHEGPSFDKLCVDMRSREKRAIKLLLSKRGKRVPASCLR